MKEMMIRLPVVEIAASDDAYLAKHYQKSGRYIVRRDNGDTCIADVQLPPLPIGEVRPPDQKATVYDIFVGQPELLDPDEWVLASEAADAEDAACAEVEKKVREMEDLRSAHEKELEDKERECQTMIEAAQAETRAAKEDFEARKAALQEQMDMTLATRRLELDQEYEMKKVQLELDTPKRFGQGEWVSGKTLKDIIEVIVGGKKGVGDKEG